MSASKRFLGKRRLGFGIGILLAAVALGVCLFAGGDTLTSDNAYIKANKVALAPEVSATIAEVRVVPNQSVHKGDVLVVLDDTAYVLAVREAEAHLAQVQNELRARKAEYAEAAAALFQAREDAEFYGRQLGRDEKLGNLALSVAKIDESRHQLKRAQAQIAINTEKQARLNAELGDMPDAPLSEQADVRVAQARLDQARYQLSRTRLQAPVDGIVANDVPKVGEMAAAGLALVNVLETQSLWIEANLKETELGKVREDQFAEVHVDAYPDLVWQARVDSLSAASGAEFALIPPQNASGNWVKVVQRVPVRLRLIDYPDEPRLRVGMSAEVVISLVERGANNAVGNVQAKAGQ